MAMNDANSERHPVDALAEEFVDRYRKGERPSLTEYTAAHPELAAEIRDLFPALVMMEDVRPGDGHRTAAPAGEPAAGAPRLERLGDYHILREVGRGGMGVVYEAEQESLGRHVALKVLPAQALLDPERLLRFQLEARAAARLHHTNIVPVFGVGEEGGHHYYVMQFIQGLGLDQVLDELKRLRKFKNGTGAGPDRPGSVNAAAVAEALLTGRFSRGPGPAPLTGAADTPPPSSLVVAPSASDSATAVHLPGQAEHTTLSESGRGIWQGVARIGVQVAEALAYAHGQGILHRDIKPSNLLLDTRGTVWVTDFGLAKASDGGDLTRTGDIVGTLRYMAPERFQGQSDPRSDLYGLGITLYELLTLRPAFDEPDRNKLLGRVLHEEPPRPRRLNPEVPRDLETVVLKATAKEPMQRYATAAELAEDLRRFLADRPVRARRASVVERLWRWGRRNPALSAALAAATTLLLTVAAVASWDAWRLHSEQEATRRELFHALVAEARGTRRSRGIGQRFDCLATVDKATQLARELHLPEEDFLELRNEVIACVALPDVRVAKELDGWPEDSGALHFDGNLKRCARVDRQQNVTIRRVADGAEICHFPSGMRQCWPQLSPDGRFLLLLWTSPPCNLWEVASPEPRQVLAGEVAVAGAFRPDSRQLALAQADGSISLYDLPSGQQVRQLEAGAVPDYLAFRPDGRQLALACRDRAQVRDLETGKVCAEFRHAEEAYPWVAWHPDGKTVATVGGDQIVHLWDVATGKQTVQLEGFKKGGINVAFNAAGDLLASSGWEATLRLWDPRTGQQLFQVRGNWHGPRFGPDGRLLAGDVKDGKLRLWEVAASRAYRTLVRNPVLGKGAFLDCAVSPQGGLLAAGTAEGIGFWDCRTGVPIEFVHLDAADSIAFEASGALLTEGAGGPFRWPVRPDSAAPGLLRIGPPQRLPLPQTIGKGLACSPDGQVVAGCQPWGALVWCRDRPGKLVRLTPHYDVRSVSVSPDGRWVATGSHWGTGVKVWDAATGRPVAHLVPTQGPVVVAFSPDSKWLATSSNPGICRLWAVESWQEGPSLGVTSGAVAFSPDGRLLAVETGQNTVRLLDPDNGREYARLEDPNQDRAWFMAFSPDGTQLVINGDGDALHVWDLRAIRAELAQRDLDWALPPYPPAADPPDAPPLRVAVDLGWLRGAAPAGAGRWEEAAAAYDQAVEQFPEEWESWYHAALVHLLRGDAEGYRRLCTRALEPFGGTEDPFAAVYLAWAGVLDAEARVDPTRLPRLAERAAAADPQSYVNLRSLGGALLRAGQPEAAVQRLSEALGVQKESPMTWLLLALAHQRLGHAEEARKWLRQAQQWIDERTPKTPEGAPKLAGPDNLPWTERLGLQLLRREAEAKVGIAAPGPTTTK
jgi:serine/threonine protein kinase/WD40 repeat protein